MVVSITATFPTVPQVPSAFFQSDPSSPALLLDVREAILPLCWLLNLQQPFLNQEENTSRVLMTIDRTDECTVRRICSLPGSRPWSKCLPCVLHLAVEHCSCVTDTGSTRRFRSVLCLPMQTQRVLLASLVIRAHMSHVAMTSSPQHSPGRLIGHTSPRAR
jgi:hypothetical protein